MKRLAVTGISPGISIGPVYRYESEPIVIPPRSCIDPEFEMDKLNMALLTANEQLKEIFQKALEKTGQQEAEIFEAHLLILEDPELNEKVHSYIKNDRYCGEYAWYRAIQDYEAIIAALEDACFAARAADIRDVGQRVLRILMGGTKETRLVTPSVIIARELFPSDTVSFDKNMILAFCTAAGGPASHVAILSRALGIPAVAGIGPWLQELKNGDEVIVDGSSGSLIHKPDADTIRRFEQKTLSYRSDLQQSLITARLPAYTRDNIQVAVAANIGSRKDAETALDYGAEGAGLLRTEFLFLKREFPPTEEEQYQVYREIIALFGDKPVTARTLDIGGDKPASYLKIEEEQNPFLGLRGTRLSLKREDVFQTQLRALLRAGRGYNLKIMFPMVGSLPEVVSANQQVEACKIQLQQAGEDYTKNVEIGIMVEVPSAAIMADSLARHVDFFSIGTNDLTQYALAVDRTNPHVAEYADALDPAVIRLIHMVTQAAHRHGKWAGICGELAGDPIAVPLLLGLHVDEFSMNPMAIPAVKQRIRAFSMRRAEQIAQEVLNLPTTAEVRSYLENVKD